VDRSQTARLQTSPSAQNSKRPNGTASRISAMLSVPRRKGSGSKKDGSPGSVSKKSSRRASPIDSPTALPEPARQSKRTDIVGLFKPIPENQSEHPPANAGNPRPGSLSCAIFQGIWRDT